MPEQAALREIRLLLPMAPDMEMVASQAATAVAEWARMSADKVDEVRMAVVEACINAFEHSHAVDKVLELTFTVLGIAEPETLCVTVRDHGVGFAPECVEDPCIETKLKAERKRGWGIKIIRGLMDDVKIQSGADGTTVVMCKSR